MKAHKVIYAIYQGEEYLGDGTAKELAQKFNVHL